MSCKVLCVLFLKWKEKKKEKKGKPVHISLFEGFFRNEWQYQIWDPRGLSVHCVVLNLCPGCGVVWIYLSMCYDIRIFPPPRCIFDKNRYSDTMDNLWWVDFKILDIFSINFLYKQPSNSQCFFSNHKVVVFHLNFLFCSNIQEWPVFISGRN